MSTDVQSTSIPSMKKEIIQSICEATKLGKVDLSDGTTADLSENQVIIFSAGCMITGVQCDRDNKGRVVSGDNTLTFPLTGIITDSAVKRYREDLQNSGPLSGSDGCIILKDATVQYSSNYKVHTPELVVFFDQILAITLGSPK